ncbi:hypothetical protein Ct61P_05779 [Colletotrichum tofieldiae]|nr:hypothetical protein Ct61P_05779 [Colletotrichum tofieldiae]
MKVATTTDAGRGSGAADRKDYEGVVLPLRLAETARFGLAGEEGWSTGDGLTWELATPALAVEAVVPQVEKLS